MTPDQAREQAPELAAALAMSEQVGAPLADVLERVADGIGDAQEAQAQRRLAFVGPVASARLLAALPLGGVGLGYALGTDPIAVLTDGGVGTIVGLVGIIVNCVGALWMRRLIADAQKEGT